MTGIVLIGHGSYASGVLSAVELVAGVPEQITAVNFVKGEGVEQLKANLIQAILSLKSQDVLVMTDIVGGSPFNVTAQLLIENAGEKLEKNIKAVAGTNLAAVIQAVFMRETIPFDCLAGEVAQAGREGVQDILAMVEST